MRKPLDEMTTVERCRWFAKNLKELVDNHEGTTEWEEAQVLEDAANEIEALQESYVALSEMLKGTQ